MKEEVKGKKMQKEEQLNSPQSFSSPTSAVSSEETRILTEYNSQKSLFNVVHRDETRRKPLLLKQFFKMKRNQLVVVSSVMEKDANVLTKGKVAAIGRDFVMLTTLKKGFGSLILPSIPQTFLSVFLPIQARINTLYMITNCNKSSYSNLVRQWLIEKN